MVTTLIVLVIRLLYPFPPKELEKEEKAEQVAKPISPAPPL